MGHVSVAPTEIERPESREEPVEVPEPDPLLVRAVRQLRGGLTGEPFGVAVGAAAAEDEQETLRLGGHGHSPRWREHLA